MDTSVLSTDPDTVRWSITSSEQFSVRSLYLHLKAGAMVGYRFIWTLKIPHKIKIFPVACSEKQYPN